MSHDERIVRPSPSEPTGPVREPLSDAAPENGSPRMDPASNPTVSNPASASAPPVQEPVAATPADPPSPAEPTVLTGTIAGPDLAAAPVGGEVQAAGEVHAAEVQAAAPHAVAAPAAEDEAGTFADGVAQFFRGFLRDLVFFVGLFLFIYCFVMNVSVVRGKSMEPTFSDGDRLIVDKLSYRLGTIDESNRFDVVVLKNPKDPSEDYIKRLIAFPGELVEMRDGILYVDGVRMDFDGIIRDRDDFRHRVRPGHYFVLGDNRARSNDSRYFDGVPRDYIKGKIRVRFWPLDNVTLFGRYESEDELLPD